MKKAVAIRYNPDEYNAPNVIAKGKGRVAENMIQKATETDLPILENEELVKDLIHIPIDEEIPKELYGVVAEILTFVNDMDELERRMGAHGK